MPYDIHIIQFRNPLTGERRNAPVGFSWTMLFFGPIPALVRGDWRWFLLILLLTVPTFGLAGIVGAFLWNRSYMTRLVEQGFQMVSCGAERDAQLDSYVGFEIPRLEGVTMPVRTPFNSIPEPGEIAAPVLDAGPRINNPMKEDRTAFWLLAGTAIIVLLVAFSTSALAGS